VKNFATILFLSRGVPMILAGDEVRRTQQGNNNTYCQDNELSWFDWSLVEWHQDVFRFFKHMIAFRKRHSILHRPRFFSGEANERGTKDIAWHGTMLDSPGWGNPTARALAFTLGGFDGNPDLHVMMNMYWEPLDFQVPSAPGQQWGLAIDTFRPSPQDILEPGREQPITGDRYRVEG
jgi:isoamylase